MTQTRYAHIEVDDGVYAPQHDSWLLADTLHEADLVSDGRVLDLCTGSGILAVEAALHGAREVLAYDISPAAVHCAGGNARRAGVDVDVRLGTLTDAREAGPFDVVVSNPPYVPSDAPLEGTGVNRAWDAGANGRVVLDQLCDAAPWLLAPGGTMLIVHSEYSDPAETLRRFGDHGFTAGIVATRTVDFGPVMTAYAPRLEAAGLLEPGRRDEELVVVRVDRP